MKDFDYAWEVMAELADGTVIEKYLDATVDEVRNINRESERQHEIERDVMSAYEGVVWYDVALIKLI